VKLDVAFCLPQEVESVSLIRVVIGDALVRLGITEECVDDIRLALSEACTNVLDHAAVEDEYEVRLKVDDETCEISVCDTGTNPLDAAALAGVMPDTGSPGGRGVAIMHAVMDHVAFRSEPETGTIVHLVKRLEIAEDSPMARLRSGG
jgi:serine/threonine-protein kinase RsbW